MSEIKTIYLPVTAFLLAVLVLASSIFIYNQMLSKEDVGSAPILEEKDSLFPNRQALQNVDLPIYEAPIILIYADLKGESRDFVSITVLNILVKINGMEINITERALFQTIFMKTDEKVLLAAFPSIPGKLTYVKAEFKIVLQKEGVTRSISVENKQEIDMLIGETYEVYLTIEL